MKLSISAIKQSRTLLKYKRYVSSFKCLKGFKRNGLNFVLKMYQENKQ